LKKPPLADFVVEILFKAFVGHPHVFTWTLRGTQLPSKQLHPLALQLGVLHLVDLLPIGLGAGRQ